MNGDTKALQTIDGQVLAAEPARPTMIRPLATPDEALDAWQAFQALKGKLVTKDDIQHIANGDFIKKSGWRKIAAAFGISTEAVDEQREDLGVGLHFLWRVRVRATAPNGRYAEGTAGCASNERKFSHVEHDVYAQAYTRACNRAISDLVGGGEVSAEEMKAEHAAPAITREQAEAVTTKFLDSTEGWYVPPVEMIGTIVMARGDLRQAYRLLKATHEDQSVEDGTPEEAPDDDE